MGRAAQFGLVTPPKLKPLPPNSIDPWSERPHRWYRVYSPTIPPIGRPSSRFIIQRTRAAGSGERSSPDRATSGQRVVNCLVRIASDGLARVDEITSHHAVEHELAFVAWIERQLFEHFNEPPDLHAFVQVGREQRCVL